MADSREVRTTSPTLQPQAAPLIDTQSWTAQFRAFSSHQQPSAYLTKGISQRPLVLTSDFPGVAPKDVKLFQLKKFKYSFF